MGRPTSSIYIFFDRNPQIETLMGVDLMCLDMTPRLAKPKMEATFANFFTKGMRIRHRAFVEKPRAAGEVRRLRHRY